MRTLEGRATCHRRARAISVDKPHDEPFRRFRTSDFAPCCRQVGHDAPRTLSFRCRQVSLVWGECPCARLEQMLGVVTGLPEGRRSLKFPDVKASRLGCRRREATRHRRGHLRGCLFKRPTSVISWTTGRYRRPGNTPARSRSGHMMQVMTRTSFASLSAAPNRTAAIVSLMFHADARGRGDETRDRAARRTHHVPQALLQALFDETGPCISLRSVDRESRRIRK